MHATSQALALDHRGRLTEYHSCDELMRLATERLSAAIVPEALYIRADGKLMLTLADDEEPYAQGKRDNEQDVVIVDPGSWNVRFSRFLRGEWPGVLVWNRHTSFGWV